MRNGFTFEGFEPANTTPVPDFLFDVLLAHLSEAELKVLLYIIRRTSGFKKSADAISLTQFQKGIKKRATGEILDEGCGLGDRTTILKALAALEKKGCIQCERSNDPQGDKAISVYRIKFRSDGVVGKPDHPSEEGSGQTRPPWWAEPTTVVGKPDHRVVGKPDLQETVIQETVIQEGEGANAPTPAHLLKEVDEKLEEVEEELERITGEHPAIHTNETPYHIASDLAIGNEEGELVLSAPGMLRLPSKTSSPQAPGTAALPPAAAVTDTVGRSPGISSVQAISTPLVAPLPAQPSPPTGDAGYITRAAQAGHIPKRPQLKSDPREVQKRIDANRGYALEEKVEVIRERQAIKTWCSLHEIGECDLVLNYLTTQDKYWKLEENKHRIGGVTLAKETPKALAALERKGKPHAPPPKKEGTDFDIYKGNGPEEREQALRDYEQHKADGTLIW